MLPDDVKLYLVDDFHTAEKLFHWMGERGQERHIAVDTETTGLVIGKDYVRLVQIGGATAGFAIPWDGWHGLFADVIKRYEGRIDMHNSKFDAGMLSHCGVDIPRGQIDDTRIMSHIVEPNYSTALKTQSARHVDHDAALAQESLHKAIGPRGKWDWDTVPITFGPYWQYGALDTVLTWHLREFHEPTVREQAWESYELELAVTWIIEKMERNGVYIDVPYALEQKRRFDDYVEQADKWIWDTYKVKAGSNPAIVRILQDEGFSFSKATASGAAALDKEVLGGLDHPLARTVLQRRQLQKLSSTYLHHYTTEMDENWLIHPSINTLGARTGRMSMERPNMQNLPRKSETNKAANEVRNCVATRYRDGTGRLLMCDFDQIEMRLLAHLSGDPNLIAAFHGKDDFFINLARTVFDDPTISNKKDPRRSVTKSVGYAEIYGAGIAKMAQTAGVPEDQIRVVKSRWDASYPKVRAFKKSVENIAWERQRSEGVPYARSPLTGRRHPADTNKIYALVNYLIQGSAAETFKRKLVELDLAGLGDYLVLPVHDEVIGDFPEDVVPDAVETLDRIMNDDTMYRVPITASVSHGERWGLKEDWE